MNLCKSSFCRLDNTQRCMPSMVDVSFLSFQAFVDVPNAGSSRAEISFVAAQVDEVPHARPPTLHARKGGEAQERPPTP